MLYIFNRLLLTFLMFFFISKFTLNFSQIQLGDSITCNSISEPCFEIGWGLHMPDARTIVFSKEGALGSYVFTYNGTSWLQRGQHIIENDRKIMMPNANTIVVGENNIAIVYKWLDSSWVVTGNIEPLPGFGNSSSISYHMPNENTLVVGQPNYSEIALEAGIIRVFNWNGTEWTQKGSSISSAIEGSGLGMRVVMSDENNLFYQLDHNLGILTWNGSDWITKGNFSFGLSDPDKGFWDIDMPDSNTIAFSVSNSSFSSFEKSKVYIYKWDGFTWSMKGMPIIENNYQDDFGYSISMSNSDNIAVGAWKTNISGVGNSCGQTKIYSWDGSTWIQRGLPINGKNVGDLLGTVVSMGDNNTVAIGAPNAGSGEIKVYKLRGVFGSIFQDLNQNCSFETQQENGLQDFSAIIQPGNILVQSDANGNWFIDSLPTGSYTITIDTTSQNWQLTCPSTQSFTVIDPNTTLLAPNFGFYSSLPCPAPDVSIHMPFMRPGFSNQKIYVKACNSNFATDFISQAFVEISLDSLIQVENFSLPYSQLSINKYKIDIGDLYPGQCVDFFAESTLSTAAMLDQTLCMEVNLFPQSNCSINPYPSTFPYDNFQCSTQWDYSNLEISNACLNDSIFISIKNNGVQLNSDMQCHRPVWIYVDNQIFKFDSIKLLNQETFTYSFAGTGQTWRVEVAQHPFNPEGPLLSHTFEMCGDLANWIPGLVNTFSLNDQQKSKDIYCGIVTGSYDPNDKIGFPVGFGEEHQILPNEEIEYIIRFQNTGTDTAFTVVIRDTLDLNLDIFSVVPGVSSHSYTFTKQGPRVLEWTFSNILLPDSSTNASSSNGFLTFTVKQNLNLFDGTQIKNKAAIYFDFNPPIITNEVRHVINSCLRTSKIKYNYIEQCDAFLAEDNKLYQKTGYYSIVPEGNTICDTIISLNLNINSEKYVENVNSCSSFYWNESQENYTNSGQYEKRYINSVGCDSILTLNLQIFQADTIYLSVSNCTNYLWNDVLLTQSGTYYENKINSNGCDSIIILDLLIFPTHSEEIISSCDNYIWNGVNYNESGTYYVTSPNTQGCDSTATLILTISNTSLGSESITNCGAIQWNNLYLDSSGTYQTVLTNSEGCDSIVTLQLVVLENSQSIETITTCDSLIWNGQTIFNSGEYQSILTNSNGCDSIINLNLTVNNSYFRFDSISACESYNFNGTNYTASGLHSFYYSNHLGCDSIIFLDLTINSEPIVVLENLGEHCENLDSFSLNSGLPPGGFYEGISVSNNFFNPQIGPGTYQILYTYTDQNGCSNTAESEIYVIECENGIDINEKENSASFLIFPNPAEENITIFNLLHLTNLKIKFFDLAGKLIFETTVETDKKEIDVSEFPRGIYFVEIENTTKKIILR